MEIEKLTTEVFEEYREQIKEAVKQSVFASIAEIGKSYWNNPWQDQTTKACNEWFESEIRPELHNILLELKPQVLEQLKTAALTASLHFASAILKTITKQLATDWERDRFIKQLFEKE